MPRYHFHTQDGHRFTDEDGTALDSVEDAQTYALRHLLEMLQSRQVDFWNHRSFNVTATDDAGLVLFAIDVTATDGPATSGRR